MVDTIWTVFAAVLVFLMQAGFAMVEGGFTRAKNVANTMMKNFGTSRWPPWASGYWVRHHVRQRQRLLRNHGLLRRGGHGGPVPGSELDVGSDPDGVVLSPDVLCHRRHHRCRRMAERTRFLSYLIFSFFISLFFYPVVGHWIWAVAGSRNGMLDFAGSTVVHSTGAWFALAGVIVLGPRLGKYTDLGVPAPSRVTT